MAHPIVERDVEYVNQLHSMLPDDSLRKEDEWDFINLTTNVLLKKAGLEEVAIEQDAFKDDLKEYVERVNRDDTKTHTMRDFTFGKKLLGTIGLLINTNNSKLYTINDSVAKAEQAIKNSQKVEGATEQFQITRYAQLNFKSLDFVNLIEGGDVMAAKAVLLDPVLKYTMKLTDNTVNKAKELLAKHTLGEAGYAEYKANVVKRNTLAELVTDLEGKARKIKGKVVQIQAGIVD